MSASNADEPTPSYTSVPDPADGTATPVTSYTRYPVAANPVLTDGADQESWIDEAVWLTLSGAEPAAGAVDCESTSLRSPSPDKLSALTANLYERPPTSPETSTDDVRAPRYASVDTAASAPLPSSMYSTYSDAASPPETTGATHRSMMLLVVCVMLDSPVGAPAAVDCLKAALTSPSPAALKPLTTNEYVRPPSSPETTALVPVDPAPSYATIECKLLPEPSVRYTVYPVTAEPPDATNASHDKLILPVVCTVLVSPLTAAADVESMTMLLYADLPDGPTATAENEYL